MKIIENHKYYIDEYKTFNEYIKEFILLVKDKKIHTNKWTILESKRFFR